MQILIAGAGGFIGGHVVRNLLIGGYSVRAVDRKPIEDWYQVNEGADNLVGDLSKFDESICAVEGVEQIINLAADMGGMGFIESHKTECMLSVLINTHLLMAARELSVNKYFFSSSACVYSAIKQKTATPTPLKEEDAYPALPEDGYGWEKLFSERMCRHFNEDFGLDTRVARFHNVYGPFGTYVGGREKAPAAICRKIAEAKISGNHEIEIWGDGEQTRSFMYIDDCITGINLIFNGTSTEPVNLGSEEMVSINQLVSIVEDIAGITVKRNYNLNAPQGVRGRTSDNTLMRSIYSWEPKISLQYGLEQTYKWVFDEIYSGKTSH
jgi:nucleoside-diphosphate-sugar epimerase